MTDAYYGIHTAQRVSTSIVLTHPQMHYPPPLPPRPRPQPRPQAPAPVRRRLGGRVSAVPAGSLVRAPQRQQPDAPLSTSSPPLAVPVAVGAVQRTACTGSVGQIAVSPRCSPARAGGEGCGWRGDARGGSSLRLSFGASAARTASKSSRAAVTRSLSSATLPSSLSPSEASSSLSSATLMSAGAFVWEGATTCATTTRARCGGSASRQPSQRSPPSFERLHNGGCAVARRQPLLVGGPAVRSPKVGLRCADRDFVLAPGRGLQLTTLAATPHVFENGAVNVLVPVQHRAPDCDRVVAVEVGVLGAPLSEHVKERLIGKRHPTICEILELVVPDRVADERVEHLKDERPRRHETPAGGHPRLLTLQVGEWVLQELERLVRSASENHRDAALSPQPPKLDAALRVGPHLLRGHVGGVAQPARVLRDVAQHAA
eukprot:7386479-Prymnesium_polylepis.2